jgi:hypothetical protein
MYDFFRFFINFISLCVRYVHDEPMCTRYIPFHQAFRWIAFLVFFFSFPTTPAKKSNIPSGLGKVSPGKEIGF